MTGTFDVVVVNLYPFYNKVTAPGGISFEDGIENIDIGGPAMIRAAAKVIHMHMKLIPYIHFLMMNVFLCYWTEPQGCPHCCRFRGLSSRFGVSQRRAE